MSMTVTSLPSESIRDNVIGDQPRKTLGTNQPLSVQGKGVQHDLTKGNSG